LSGVSRRTVLPDTGTVGTISRAPERGVPASLESHFTDGNPAMTAVAWTLRTATEKDLVTIVEMLEEAGLPVEGLTDFAADSYVVAEQDGIVVGAGGVEVHGCYGLLRSVVVRPVLQGRGVGGKIVGERVRWCAARGLRAVYLLTTTAPDFFEGAGFNVMSRNELPSEVQRSKEFSEVCPVSATAMVLRLDPLC
jgi:amino-acid N-acetyltransferase